jgi:hypothetical protein
MSSIMAELIDRISYPISGVVGGGDYIPKDTFPRSRCNIREEIMRLQGVEKDMRRTIAVDP